MGFEERLTVLSAALRAFAEATKDYDELVDVIARTVADVVGDGCIVRLLDEGDLLAPVAFHLPLEKHVPDAAAARRVRAFLERPQRVADYAWGVKMIATGEPFVAPRLDRALLTPEVAEVYDTVGIHSLLVIPLRVRGETIGTLSLFRIERSAPPFGDRDRELAQALADHAALAITNARLLRSALRLEESTRQANEGLRLLIDGVRDYAIFLLDPTGRVVSWNAGAERITGYAAGEIVGEHFRRFHPPEEAAQGAAEREIRTALAAGRTESEGWRIRKGGERFWANVVVTALRDRAGNHVGFAVVTRDLTERRKLEEQYRQAQKMEAVGRLAGSVAHDFNNVLSIILSYAELIAADLDPAEPLRADIDEIKNAGVRATELTKQLLAFSRRQVLEPRVLDLNQTVAGMEKMLRRLLGADVELAILPTSGLWSVRADPGQVEQVLLNLAVNARDAMPTGGRLTIQTDNVELDDEYASAHADVRPGPYVMLATSDTGTGMDAQTQARIFEPFFTTKEKGKGTGLGLATVFGIVKQSGGHIWVYSEPGAGTTFKIYLPRVEDVVAEAAPPRRTTPVSSRGNETILLVDDDDHVRSIARNILRRSGYVVLEASNGGEAILICEQHGAKIHLLLTDVVLPRMSGRQLAERLVSMRPEMKVLFMSGYTDDAVFQHGVLDSGVAYLQKPITPAILVRKVRDVLGGEQKAS